MSVESYTFEAMQIAYAVSGQPGDHPLVFLHNAGASRHLWAAQVDHLEATREIFVLDLFGYGSSDVPDSGYTVRRYRDLLTNFLADRVPANPVVIGNCLGSAVILDLLLADGDGDGDGDDADRDSARLAGAVLINPLTAATATAGRYGALVGPAGKIPGFVRGWIRRRGLPRRAARQVVGEWFADPTLVDRLPAAGLLVEQLRRPGRVAALGEMIADLETLARPDVTGLPDSAPPICTLWGTDNVILSADAGRELNRTLRPEREEWLDGCGHAAMLERSAEVSGIINDFVLSEVASSARASG